MENIRVGEFNGDIRVGVGRRIIFQRESCAVEAQFMGACKHLRGQRSCGRRPERKLPTFNPRVYGEVFAGVLVGGDFGARRVQPLVAVGVIGMPVRVDRDASLVPARGWRALRSVQAAMP